METGLHIITDCSGTDSQYNYVGPYLLTRKLLFRSGTRIVNMVSCTMLLEITFSRFLGPWHFANTCLQQYQTGFTLLLRTRCYGRTRTTVNAADPGITLLILLLCISGLIPWSGVFLIRTLSQLDWYLIKTGRKWNRIWITILNSLLNKYIVCAEMIWDGRKTVKNIIRIDLFRFQKVLMYWKENRSIYFEKSTN